MDICFQILDNSKDALKNPGRDTDQRCEPVYISRMVTAMVKICSEHHFLFWTGVFGLLFNKHVMSTCDLYKHCHSTYFFLSAQVNSNGDKGVLTGRWEQPYSDGVAPYRWTGSVPILQQWRKAGMRAVKYGQCWVFAGIACTGRTFTAEPVASFSMVLKD